MSAAGAPEAARRFLLVSPFFPPIRAVAADRVHSFAAELVSAGHRVDVLTTRKGARHATAPADCAGMRVHEIDYRVPAPLARLRGLDPAGQPDQAAATEAAGGSSTNRGGPGLGRLARRVRRRTGIFSGVRMPDLTDTWVRPAIAAATRIAETEGPWDVMLSSAGPYTAHLAALPLRRRGVARRWIAEYRDLWTGNVMCPGLLPWRLRERRLEARVTATADALIAISEPMAEQLRAVTQSPVHVVYNGFPAANFQPPADPAEAGRRPGRGRPLRIVFTGSLKTQQRDIDSLVAGLAGARVRGTDVQLEIAGEGHESFLEIAARHGARAGIRHHGVLGRTEATGLQRRADALLSIECERPEAGVLTTKLFDYLAAGPPIVVTGARGELTRIVETTGRGIWLGDEPTGIATALSALAEEPPSLVPDIPAVKAYTREHQAQQLRELLETMAGASRPTLAVDPRPGGPSGDAEPSTTSETAVPAADAADADTPVPTSV